jgi:hypothetical protein
MLRPRKKPGKGAKGGTSFAPPDGYQIHCIHGTTSSHGSLLTKSRNAERRSLQIQLGSARTRCAILNLRNQQPKLSLFTPAAVTTPTRCGRCAGLYIVRHDYWHSDVLLNIR